MAKILDAWAAEPHTAGLALGAAIADAAHAHDEARRNPHLKLVVSGPTSTVIHARRTEQVLLQLIAEARREILLLTFALQMHDGLRRALGAASSHGVRLTVLAEDPTDNHGFSGDPGTALIGVLAQRHRWPAEKRPANGAAMHAKIVAVDATTALITSANLTRRAAGDNLEVGVLIRGGDIPERLARHVAQLPAAARSMTVDTRRWESLQVLVVGPRCGVATIVPLLPPFWNARWGRCRPVSIWFTAMMSAHGDWAVKRSCLSGNPHLAEYQWPMD